MNSRLFHRDHLRHHKQRNGLKGARLKSGEWHSPAQFCSECLWETAARRRSNINESLSLESSWLCWQCQYRWEWFSHDVIPTRLNSGDRLMREPQSRQIIVCVCKGWNTWMIWLKSGSVKGFKNEPAREYVFKISNVNYRKRVNSLAVILRN